jgi:hypothetical protein
MLFALEPMPASAPRLRQLYMVERLYAAMMEHKATRADTERFAKLEADLGVFVNSPTIDPKYLFGLAPARDSVWEIRSVRGQPSIRVLGLFAAKDVFVATNYALRSDLHKWESKQWKEAKRRARTEWTHLFNPYQPVGGRDVNALFSGAISGKYFKNSPD